MSREEKILLGVMLLIISILIFAVSSSLLAVPGHLMWHYGSMMKNMALGLNQSQLKDVSGTVENIGWMQIELEDGQGEIEVHGPSWFWKAIGVKEGDYVWAKGVFAYMMEPEEGWHEEFIPYELTVNGRIYGDAGRGIPIWMQ